VEAAKDGSLTAERLDDLIAEAAAQQSRVTYRGDMKRSCARPFVNAFFTELQSGAADEILDSLRERFIEAADAIDAARNLINPESSVEHILASGTPELVTAWQGLDAHLGVIKTIAAVASSFGPRLGKFALIEEFALGDNFKLDDRAIFCCGGDLVTDSALFGRPDQGHRTSPWFKAPLRLHTVAGARDRYRAWAAAEFDRIHSGPAGGWLDEAGQMHEQPKPPNPFRDKELTK
jgi:hypothetical protein